MNSSEIYFFSRNSFPSRSGSHASSWKDRIYRQDVKDFPICYQSPEYLNSLKSPRTLHTHMPFRFLPKQHLNRKGKVIALFRNPKDNVVSNYHFMSGIAKTDFEFQEFLDAFCEGKCKYNLEIRHDS